MDVHVLYAKKVPSVCLSLRLPGCLAVRTYTCILAVDKIIFEGVNGSEQNLVHVLYV